MYEELLINLMRVERRLSVFIAFAMLPLVSQAIPSINDLNAVEYPISVAGVQVTDENAANVLSDDYSSVSYDPTTYTLTLKGAQFDAPISVGEGIEQLTVHLVGYNAINNGQEDNPPFVLPEGTSLTFTTSTMLPGSLTTYKSIQAASIDCQNGLKLTDNDGMCDVKVTETDNTRTASFSGYVQYINEEYINEEPASFYIYSKNIEFHASKASYSYATGNGYGVTVFTGSDGNDVSMWSTSLDNGLLKKVTVQFDWGTNTTNRNVTVQLRGLRQNVTNYQYETDGKVYSEAVSLAEADADGIVVLPLTATVTSDYVEIYFSSQNGEFSLMPLNFGFDFCSAYPLSVAGRTVSELNATDVLGDGTVSYNATDNVLMLANAQLNGDDSSIFYYGDEALTIALSGSNSVSNIYQEGKTETPLPLTIKRAEGAADAKLTLLEDFTGSFSEVIYEDLLTLSVLEDEQITTFNVVTMKPTINTYLDGFANRWMVSVQNEYSEQNQNNGTVKYSLTYADEKLAAYNVTDQQFSEDFALRGPATITATLTVNDQVSPTVTAYYFGILPNPLTVVFDGTETVVTPTLYPIIEGVSFEPTYSPGNFAAYTESSLNVSGVGSGLAFGRVIVPDERNYSVVTDSIAFMVNVVPVAPTVSLEGGSVEYNQTIELTVPETLTDAAIYYKWDDETSGTLYEGPIAVQTGTLKTWTVVTESNAGDTGPVNYQSATVEVEYEVHHTLVVGEDVSFAAGQQWATYYNMQDDLELPEGIAAYVVSDIVDNTVTLTALSYIPRNVPVLLEQNAETVEGSSEAGNNLLIGTSQPTAVNTISNGVVYVLYNGMFVKSVSGVIPANRAFLVLGGVTAVAGAPDFLYFGFDTTKILTVTGKTADKDGWYHLNGSKLTAKPTAKGLYIHNGKKTFVSTQSQNNK